MALLAHLASCSFAQDITPHSLVTVHNAGTNLIVALSQKQSLIFTLASEFSLVKFADISCI
jgi:oligosaccharyltransferase complex subunit beta